MAERPKLADGELFVSERVVKDGKVIYQAADAHTDWEHDSEKAVPGLVCTAFIPPKAGQDAPELASIKKLTTQQEKSSRPGAGIPCILCQQTGALCGHGYQWTERKMAITKAELFGRLLNVTVAIQDPSGVQDDGSEALSEEHVVTIPEKKLPRFGNLGALC